LNLAEHVVDGQRIVVLRKGESAPAGNELPPLTGQITVRPETVRHRVHRPAEPKKSRPLTALEGWGEPQSSQTRQTSEGAPESDGQSGTNQGNSPPAKGSGGWKVKPAPAQQSVSLNSATLEQLQALPGVGPVTAQKILDYRKEHGGFRSVDELVAVKSIGAKRAEALRPYLRL
jgi:competence protein ComEA